MLKFKAINLEGKEVIGYGVLECEEAGWVLFTEKGYIADIVEEEMGAALYEYVRKETIEIIRE